MPQRDLGELGYLLKYHPFVKNHDLPKIEPEFREKIKKFLESKFIKAPQIYGEPLRGTFKGFWKQRLGEYVITFKVNGREIVILAIKHRKDIFTPTSMTESLKERHD